MFEKKELGVKRLVLSVVAYVALMFSIMAVGQEVVFEDSLESPDNADPVTITSFIATPNPVEASKITTISWITENAESCSATAPAGDFDGEVETNGSVDIIIPTAGSYDYLLTCQGPSGPVIEPLTLTVEEATSPAECDPSPLAGVIAGWTSFWGAEFPGPNFEKEEAIVPKSGYVALQFETGDVVDHGQLATVNNTFTRGIRTGAVSECPGDFAVAPECKKSWGTGGVINWATDGLAGGCPLKPSTTYYFNVTFTDGFDPSSSTCVIISVSKNACIATLQATNL